MFWRLSWLDRVRYCFALNFIGNILGERILVKLKHHSTWYNKPLCVKSNNPFGKNFSNIQAPLQRTLSRRHILYTCRRIYLCGRWAPKGKFEITIFYLTCTYLHHTMIPETCGFEYYNVNFLTKIAFLMQLHYIVLYSVGYYSELRVAIWSYRPYHFLPAKLYRIFRCAY